MLYLHRAESSASLLWLGLLAFHYHQLLPEVATAGHSVEPGSVPHGAGIGSTAVSLRGGGICHHARTRSPADHRTGAGRSVGSHEGSEAGICPTAAPDESFPSGITYAGAGRIRSDMAAAVLRFRRVLGQETGGEAALHAAQSGEARTGSGAAALGLEQFPVLRVRRTGACGSQRAAES